VDGDAAFRPCTHRPRRSVGTDVRSRTQGISHFGRSPHERTCDKVQAARAEVERPKNEGFEDCFLGLIGGAPSESRTQVSPRAGGRLKIAPCACQQPAAIQARHRGHIPHLGIVLQPRASSGQGNPLEPDVGSCGNWRGAGNASRRLPVRRQRFCTASPLRSGAPRWIHVWFAHMDASYHGVGRLGTRISASGSPFWSATENPPPQSL